MSRIWIRFLKNHHTRIPLSNKLILGIWGHLPSQLLKSISNVVGKIKFFTIFAPFFLRFKKFLPQLEMSDLLPPCNELLVSKPINSGKFFMIIEKALSKFAYLYDHVISLKNAHFHELWSNAPYFVSVVFCSRKTFRVMKIDF